MNYRIAKIKLISCILFVIVFMIASLFFVLKSRYRLKVINNHDKYDHLIAAAAKRHNIDPNLIKAVIWQESAFSESATGSKNEKGLMQLMQKYSVQDYIIHHGRNPFPDGLLYDPQVNIEIGSWYMAKCIRRWKNYPDNIAIGLAEYNAGYSNVRGWLGKVPPSFFLDVVAFPSTKAYCIKILEKYKEYKNSDKDGSR